MQQTFTIEQEMTLPKDLKSSRFQTNVVKNFSEISTMEKGYRATNPFSGDSSQATVNIPSISGGYMRRVQEVQGQIDWAIKFKPVPLPIGGDKLTATTYGNIVAWNKVGGGPIDGATVATITCGSSPAPFLPLINCLDSFPLSKILNDRQYIFNNASTTISEKLESHQINFMVSQLDYRKLKNWGVHANATANCHFLPLCYSTGGVVRSSSVVKTDAPGTAIEQKNVAGYAMLQNLTTDQELPSIKSLDFSKYIMSAIQSQYTSLANQHANENIKWIVERNTNKMVVKSTLSTDFPTIAGVSLGYLDGVYVPTWTSTATGPAVFAVYSQVDRQWNFSATLREQLISQYFDSELAYNEFQENMLMPISSLNVTYKINTAYLENSFLQIGDNVGDVIDNGGTYSFASKPALNLANTSLIIRTAKIPPSLLPESAYKQSMYLMSKPQGGSSMKFANGKFTTTISYANLAKIPEYLYPVVLIDRVQFATILNANGIKCPLTCQLPSVMTLPITKFRGSLNSDAGILTYELDKYQLENFTLENLQNNEENRDLISGKSTPYVDASTFASVRTIKNTTGATLSTTIAGLDSESPYGYFVRQALPSTLPLGTGTVNSNGVSNGSFYILKMGSQLRLPENYVSSMIVNYNLDLEVECDVSGLANYCRNIIGLRNDYKVFQDLSAVTSLLEAATSLATLDIFHINKSVLTISGDANQTIYEHNIQMTSQEFLALRNTFVSGFVGRAEYSQDSISTNMMLGGSILSRIGDKAKSAYEWLKPRVGQALDLGRKGIDVGKEIAPSDSAIAKYLNYADKGLAMTGHGEDIRGGALNIRGGMEDPSHTISGGRGRGRSSGTSKAKFDYRQYL